MKKTKQHEKIINALKNASEILSMEKEHRQEFFDEKSEKWQESETGENYQNDIDKLEEIHDEIENQLNEFEELFNND